MSIYGYCRVSTKKQNIERQEYNIKCLYPNAIIYKEAFTGAETIGRKVFMKLLDKCEKDDIIVFDSVSRMSRNAEEGFELYQMLYNKGIELVFLKEPHINTQIYKKTLKLF